MITIEPRYHLMAPPSRIPPACPYCWRRADLVDSMAVYKTRSFGPIWICVRCEAWVGCHRNSKDYAPLGRLADGTLRRLKMEVHAFLDPWWRDLPGGARAKKRKTIYALLGAELGLEAEACHVGEMDDALCERAIDLLSSTRWRVLAAGSITHSTNET